MRNQKAVRRILYPYLWIISGCVLYALSFNCFFVPNNIAYGGFTGIAILLNALLAYPAVGTWIILLNIPLFVLGWRIFGLHSVLSSLFSMLLSSFFIDLFHVLFPFPSIDPLLASLYGGLGIGLALGIILLQGSNTGGTELAARLLRRKFAGLSMGRLILVLDVVIIASSALVFRTLHSALYGIIALSLSTFIIDRVLLGPSSAKVAYIISNHHAEIAQAIVHTMERGVTLLHGQGAYSGSETKVLLCAFKKRQIVALKKTVREIDPHAFLIVCQAHEVLGMGFQSYSDNEK